MQRLLPIIMLMVLTAAGCSAPPEADTDPELLLGAGQYAAALASASSALDADPDSAAAARLHYVISECHRHAGDPVRRLSYAEAAAAMAPRDTALRLNLIDALIAAGEADRALDSIGPVPASADALRLTAAAQLAAGRRDRAASTLKRLHDDREWLPTEMLVALADAYRSEGRPDSAAAIIASTDASTAEAAALNALAAYYLHSDPARSARLYARLAAARDSAARAVASGSLYGRLYELEHAELERQQARTLRLGIGALTLGALLIAFIALLLYRRAEGRKKLLETENRLLAAADEMRTHAEQTRSTIGRLFRESHNAIEMAANMLLDTDASRSGAEGVMRRLRSQVEQYRSPEFIAGLETAVNADCNNVIARMRADVPSLTDGDITIALYSAAGLSPRVICLLLDCSPTSLYNKKYRLKRKIQDSPSLAEAKEEYLNTVS